MFPSMKPMAYCVYREDEFVVAQCLNADVSSFGATREEEVANLKEAVELYFEGETGELPIGTTRSIIRQSGLVPSDFGF